MMPFAGGIENTSNGTLLFSVALAVVYALIVLRPASTARTVAKTVSVLLLAVVAAIEGGPFLLVAALVLGAIGDAFLSRSSEKAFLAGLVAFLFCHLAYVSLFLQVGDGIGALSGLRLAAAIILAFAAGGFLAWLWPALPGDMRIPVLAYAAAIIVMGILSLSVPNPLVALGGALFILSDALLATARFRLAPDAPSHSLMAYAVWSFYYIAQLTLMLSVLAIA